MKSSGKNCNKVLGKYKYWCFISQFIHQTMQNHVTDLLVLNQSKKPHIITSCGRQNILEWRSMNLVYVGCQFSISNDDAAACRHVQLNGPRLKKRFLCVFCWTKNAFGLVPVVVPCLICLLSRPGLLLWLSCFRNWLFMEIGGLEQDWSLGN